MKLLRVVVRSVDYSTYETEVEDDFNDTAHDINELFWEEGFTWPRVSCDVEEETVFSWDVQE